MSVAELQYLKKFEKSWNSFASQFNIKIYICSNIEFEIVNLAKEKLLENLNFFLKSGKGKFLKILKENRSLFHLNFHLILHENGMIWQRNNNKQIWDKLEYKAELSISEHMFYILVSLFCKQIVFCGPAGWWWGFMRYVHTWV